MLIETIKKFCEDIRDLEEDMMNGINVKINANNGISDELTITKEYLKYLSKNNNDQDKIICRLISYTYNKSVKEIVDNPEEDKTKEIASWIFSLYALKKIFEVLNGDIEVVLEAQFERLERADVVLVGTKNKQPAIIIIENKRWSKLGRYKYYGENTVWNDDENRPVQHPSRQAYRHRTILEDHNKYVQDNIVQKEIVDKTPIYAFVYMINGKKWEKDKKVGPFSEKFNGHLNKVPIFTGEEVDEIKGYIENMIDGGRPGLAKKIYSSPINDSVDFIKSSLESWKISEDKLNRKQIELFDEICKKVISDSENKSVYIIEGMTGTGKTFLANTLLHKLFKYNDDKDNKSQRKILVRYIEKNRAPRIYQKTILNMPEDLMFCSVPFTGDDSQEYDCLICDEAHRMPEFVMGNSKGFIEYFIKKTKIAVFFLDEKQHVHVNDFVKIDNITRIAEKSCNLKLDESIFVHSLTLQERCPSAEYYLEVLKDFLYDKSSSKKPTRLSKNNKYEIKLVDNKDDLLRIIKDKNDEKQNNRTSRVVSGKGLKAKWECYFKGEKIHATDEESVNKVGNIDTCQGLDFEYIGVIIESDLVYNKKLDIKVENHQHDDNNISAKLTRNEKKELKNMYYGNRRNKTFIRYLRAHNQSLDDIKEIIKNTYYVLLTRGAKGCYIYCCDPELRKFLMNDIGIQPLK